MTTMWINNYVSILHRYLKYIYASVKGIYGLHLKWFDIAIQVYWDGERQHILNEK